MSHSVVVRCCCDPEEESVMGPEQIRGQPGAGMQPGTQTVLGHFDLL